MNYTNTYKSLIDKARNRINIDGYYESHHILPRCLGGDDSPDNLVNLTAKEHFVAHHLLWKIFPNHDGIIQAFDMMHRVKDKNQDRYVPSRYYEKLKIEISRISSERMTGKQLWLGKKHTIESRDKISKSQLGKITPTETRVQISNTLTGRKLSNNTVTKMLESNKDYCEYCELDTTKGNKTMWHGPNATRNNSKCKTKCLELNNLWQ